MTRRALPKPVEAWAVLIGDDYQQFADGVPICYMRKPNTIWSDMRVIRVRIVPVTPKKSKPRTKRKEKKK